MLKDKLLIEQNEDVKGSRFHMEGDSLSFAEFWKRVGIVKWRCPRNCETAKLKILLSYG